ncbi:hypothetical protein C8T65DRAFT_59172 [Cerioporus squamosus]|nr:hypothetical protein C8T65DRAFT_59172 [Cerioporus squamosus]
MDIETFDSVAHHYLAVVLLVACLLFGPCSGFRPLMYHKYHLPSRICSKNIALASCSVYVAQLISIIPPLLCMFQHDCMHL